MSTAAQKLDDWMDQDGPVGEPEGFSIGDSGAADWALRKMARSEAKYREARDLVDRETEKLTAFLEHERKEMERTTEFFSRHLIDYHQRILQEDPKAKTVHFPHGELRARKDPDRVDVEDSAVDKLPKEFQRIKVTPDKKAILKHVKDTGEVLEGVTFVPGDIRYTVKAEV